MINNTIDLSFVNIQETMLFSKKQLFDIRNYKRLVKSKCVSIDKDYLLIVLSF